MTIFTAKPNTNERAYRYGLDRLPSGSGVGARFREDLANNPFTGLLRDSELDTAERGAPTYAFRAPGPRKQPDSPLLEPDEANAKFGIPGQLTFDKPIRERAAKILNGWTSERLERESVLRRADSALTSKAGRFSASLLAQALDPINIATAFIPVVGEVRYARWIGKAASGLERAGVRAGVGAAEGALGAAVVEPLIYLQAQRQQRPYELWDSFANVVFGGILGGGLHVAGGAIKDRVTRTTGERLVRDIGAETHSAALRGAVAALAEDRPVRVASAMHPSMRVPIVEADAADIVGSIAKFTTEAMTESKQRLLRVGEVPKPVSDRLASLGVEVSGYSHVMQTDEVRHALQRHGVGAKLQAGELPITEADMARVPEIIETAEDIRIERTRQGRQAAIFTKRDEATTVLVEEVRDKKGRLAFKSMRKFQRGNEPTGGVEGGPGTTDAGEPQSLRPDREPGAASDNIGDPIQEVHAPDAEVMQSIDRIEKSVSGRIEADNSIEAQLKEAEESLAQIEPLIREGDERTIEAANDLVSQANREAKAYEVMAACYMRRA